MLIIVFSYHIVIVARTAVSNVPKVIALLHYGSVLGGYQKKISISFSGLGRFEEASHQVRVAMAAAKILAFFRSGNK